jgi:hypothetical protein
VEHYPKVAGRVLVLVRSGIEQYRRVLVAQGIGHMSVGTHAELDLCVALPKQPLVQAPAAVVVERQVVHRAGPAGVRSPDQGAADAPLAPQVPVPDHHATHGPAIMPTVFVDEKVAAVWETRLVDYDPAWRQALRAVAGWVETGKELLQDSVYRFDEDNALVLPTTANERGGIQPIVTALANGGLRAEIARGARVELTGTVAVPPGAGTVVAAEWDFEGQGT